MELVLIRHAEPVRVLNAVRADPGLHERGYAHARLTSTYLADEPLLAVYSSPLLRAVETAEPIAHHHGVEVVVDDELAEYDREATDYVPLEELKASGDERWLAMAQGRLEGGIDPVAFRAGVVTAVERVIAAHPGGQVAVVCHGGVINAYLGHVLGIERALWFEPRYASVHRVAASRSGIRTVVTLNEGPRPP